MTLDSIVPSSGDFDVYITLCIGAGVTGTQKGGEGDTRTFAFNFYGSASLGDQGFSPSVVTGQVTGVPATGTFVPTFMGSSYTIAYIDPGSQVPFICVSSTAQCGSEHTQCDQYVFTMNELFDSVRAVGIEGAGNPVAGCYPDADMLIDLSTSLEVEWTYFDGFSDGHQVRLDWGVYEFDAGKYEIFRGRDGEGMQRVGSVLTDQQSLTYSWRDEPPAAGNYRYQLVHHSLNGGRSESEIVNVRVLEMGEGLVVVPSLVRDVAEVRFFGEENQARRLCLFGADGRELYREVIAGVKGLNEFRMDLSGFSSGVYLVELRGENTVEVERIVHQ